MIGLPIAPILIAGVCPSIKLGDMAPLLQFFFIAVKGSWTANWTFMKCNFRLFNEHPSEIESLQYTFAMAAK
jgi:hypothetical protein